MARDYICLYHSYLDAIQALGDAERGRLLTAMLEYSITGAAPQLGGNERYIFPMVKAQIDRDRERYEETCRSNSGKGKLGGRPRKSRSFLENPELSEKAAAFSKSQKSQGKGKGEGKGKGKSPSGNSARGAQDPAEMVRACSFAPDLESAVNDWLKYKAERRESYKPTGLKSLLTQIQNNAAEYGDSAVAEVIRQSMGSNYQGIVYDRLKRSAPKAAPQTSNIFAQMLSEGEFTDE